MTGECEGKKERSVLADRGKQTWRRKERTVPNFKDLRADF